MKSAIHATFVLAALLATVRHANAETGTPEEPQQPGVPGIQ